MKPRLPPIARGPRRGWLALLAANGLLQGLAAAAASLALGRLAGAATGTDQTAAALLTVAAAALLLALLQQRERVDAERLGQDYAIEVRDRLFESAFADLRGAAGPSPGAVLLRFVSDLNGLRQWASRGLAVLIGDGLFLAVLLLVIGIAAPLLAAVAGGGVLLLGGLMLLVRRPLRAADGELRRLRARLSGGVARRLAERGPDFELHRERRRLRRRGEALAEAAIERARWQGITRGAALAVGLLTIAAMLLIAGRSAIAAEPGALVTVIAVASLIGAPLRRLARAFELRQTWRVARARAESLLRNPIPEPAALAAPAA
jgi:ATP-binding cassette subfamily B protein